MNRMPRTLSPRQRGVTLIELLVAVVIGMVVVLVATNVVVIGEAHKRSTTSTNDIGQSGAFAAYAMDKALRSAGSGFAQAWDQSVFGCKPNVSSTAAGGSILPRTTPFPAPFQGFLGGGAAPTAAALVLAPVLIGQNQSAGGSDVIMVMSGNGSAGDIARPIRSSVAGTNLRLDSTVGLQNGDLGLVTQPGNATCYLEQVAVTDAAAFGAAGNDVLPMGGKYGNTASLGAIADSGTGFFSALGNVNANNLQFQLFGVDTNRTLVAYDLLRSAAVAGNTDPVQPIADGVAEIHAIYGIDSTNPHDNIVDSWQLPTGTWDIAQLITKPDLMRQIVAIRVAIVLRSSNYEQKPVTAERPALFADTPTPIAAVPYVATDDNAHFRLRVIETTIPLRNMLLLPAS
ncbi:PilW family protein [Variovorax sp. GT1P44]|uniref:PilW family protein n=1 Tax=Variovorax sp. GT1P44 TaxID=3443742 RepID=UPI003F44DA56